jgi:hypothetical protein
MDLENKGQKVGGKPEKKGVPRIHGRHAPWELLFPRSALFLLIILWKTALCVWSIMLENKIFLYFHLFQ